MIGPANQTSPGTTFWLIYGLVVLAGLALLLHLALIEPALRHWYVVPVFVCLMIVAYDTTNLLAGRVPLFSPLGLFGILGVQFFFLAPLLHVYLDYWMNYTVAPGDWRPWLGAMATLNALGLMAFHCGRRLLPSAPMPAKPHRWTVDPAAFFHLGLAVLVLSLVLQTWIYARFGGIGGYIAAYQIGQSTRESPFTGMGRLMMVAELFPIVAGMMVAIFARRAHWRPSMPTIVLMLVILLGCCLYFGGLRGSRSNTIWPLFWGVMIIHLWLRPLSPRMLVAGVTGLTAFMYIYGLYKGIEGGRGLVDVVEGRVTLEELEQRTEKPIEKVFLVDLGRADLQALILQRLSEGMYEPAGGRTYLAAFAMLVPRSLWPDRPPNKMKEGSAMRFGPGAFEADTVSWFVHGLAGEAMLNFGPLGVIPAFLLYGVAMSALHRFVVGVRPDDARILWTPFATLLAILLLTSDFDNLLWFVCKVAALPCLLVYVASRPAPPMSAAPPVPA